MVEIRTPQTDQEWLDYYDLRYRILREPLGKERGSEKNEGDETGIHFALYENNTIKAIARLDLQEDNQAQVRFVAVENDSQGKGFGRLIMLETEKKAKQLNCSKLVLHARENALEFYKRLNYRLIEKSYNLFNLVQHYYMEKEGI